MAIDPSSSGGPVAHINVTPLVDVMLVLLVIFMVTAPMLQQGVDVRLPKAQTASMKGSAEQIVVSLDAKGKVYVGAGNQVTLAELPKKIKAIMQAKKTAGDKVYIQADENINYGSVMDVISALYQGDIAEVGLVTDLPEKTEDKNK